MDLNLEEKVELLSSWLQEKKANSVVSVDVRDKCTFTEYLIICTGTATLHNKALADYVLDKARENKIKILGKEGFEACTWILIDMNDVIMHIFTEETLNLYKLEDLWKSKNIIQE
ncbi:MAG: ribosome silencing factor [Candidatus Cloacimonetes bacterium]|nr:ribosome silencing factor [Candidatus Cloacimonadota bacterium]